MKTSGPWPRGMAAVRAFGETAARTPSASFWPKLLMFGKGSCVGSWPTVEPRLGGLVAALVREYRKSATSFQVSKGPRG